VTLSIDAARAFRYDSELRELVQAVRDSGVHDESEWIEWKIAVDGTDTAREPLLTATADELIARAVLGFANRMPEVAQNWAEGHAYLLIGVQPGEVRGIRSSDPEKIHSRLRPYVGGHISWRPEYTTVDGQQVLVVIVDPPRPGDPIHTLQKGAQNRQPGMIFVRHPGKTEQADPADIAKLTARANARHSMLDITITARHDSIEAVEEPHDYFESWAEMQRSTLLAARHRAPAHRLATIDVAALMAYGTSVPDPRTEEEYAGEVESYMAKAMPALTIRAVGRQARRAETMLTLEVANGSDDHVGGLYVEAHVLGASGYSEQFLHETEDHPEPHVPAAPVPLGTPRQTGGISLLASQLAVIGADTWLRDRPLRAPLSLRRQPSRGWSCHGKDDMLHIEYDAIDLLPATTLYFPPVPLRVSSDGRSSVRIIWTAASTNLKGRLGGEFDLAVTPPQLDLLSASAGGDPAERAS
jgi:hypothetical protein